jgi:hypothetical protein
MNIDNKKPISINTILKESEQPLSLEEILAVRHDVSALSNKQLDNVRLRLTKHIARLQLEGKIFKARRKDGTVVWADVIDKIERNSELDYYRLPIKELFRKYGS